MIYVATKKRISAKRLIEEEQKIEREEKNIEAEEKKIEKKEAKIEKIEKEILFKIGKFKVSKKHVFDVTKITAGALLGTGLGQALAGYTDLTALPWLNTVGIFALSVALSALMLYKEEKTEIKQAKEPALYLTKRVVEVYLISFFIVAATLVLFSPEALALDLELFLKIVLIGSFSAVSGAITFSLL